MQLKMSSAKIASISSRPQCVKIAATPPMSKFWLCNIVSRLILKFGVRNILALESGVNTYYCLLFQLYVTVTDEGVSIPSVNGHADFNNVVPAVCDIIFFHMLPGEKFKDGGFRAVYISHTSI